jgi:SAM-dependent methyltransferase
VDLTSISKRLTRGESGIWTPAPTAQGASAPISFPEAGYNACFELEDSSFWFAHRNEVISTALAQHRFEGPFLDVGGGNGAVSRRLDADGLETVMLEPGPEGATNARTRGLQIVVCTTLDEAGFEPASFGGAGLFDVIEHVEDDEGLLRSVRRVLRPGGVLAVTVPAYEWLWSTEDEVAGHHRRYTRRRLRRVLERASFDVRYATYFFAPLTVPIFFARSMRYRLGRRSSEEVWSASEGQHKPNAAARKAVELLLAPELRRIRAGRLIPFGTSCLAIARAR